MTNIVLLLGLAATLDINLAASKPRKNESACEYVVRCAMEQGKGDALKDFLWPVAKAMSKNVIKNQRRRKA